MKIQTNAEAIERIFTAEMGKRLFQREHDRGNIGLHRRHYARPPTRGFWKGCRCFGCRAREANAPRAKALAGVLARTYAKAEAVFDAVLITKATPEHLARLADVYFGAIGERR